MKTKKTKPLSLIVRQSIVGVASVLMAGLPLQSVSAASDPVLQTAMNTIVAAGYPGAYVNDSGKTAAAGVADVVTGRKMRPYLRMRVGSLTKSFVAAVALQLVDEGKLSLDDTVDHWKPGLLPYGNQITLRMLLQHTSGVPDYLENGSNPQIVPFINDPAYRTRTWTPRQIVALVSSQPPDFTPGATADYSDTNYIIAGMIIEAASHHTIRYEIQNRIITPLHLTYTSFPITRSTLSAPFSHGYSFLLDPVTHTPLPGTLTDETAYNPSLFWATGALVSNPADINSFYQALLGGHLLSASLTAQMKQTVPVTDPNFPPGIGFGLGIWSWQLPCIQVWGHEGEIPGYNTYSFSTVDGSRTITMEANQLKATDPMFLTAFATYQSLWCSSTE
jgi:D-alanyl-D-alanine carboxypeptidase